MDNADIFTTDGALSFAMDLSSTLPPEVDLDSYVGALSTLQGAKALLLSTADERKGLRELEEKKNELVNALEDQSNIQNLNDIHLMRQFYDDVTNSSARVDARIRAIESVQWLDLDDKYGIRRQNILGESRNMRAIEEKAMRTNAMAALKHYLGEFQVKKIKSQLESADAWFGQQEKRLREEVLMLNPDGSDSLLGSQTTELIESALTHENIDPNLLNIFTKRGQSLSEASHRIYQSFSVWARRAKQQLESTKLETAAASKHLKARLLSAEAESSVLRARCAELEAAIAASGADESGIRADIAEKYLPSQNSLQAQVSQLRDRMAEVTETIANEKEELANAMRMARSLKNYDPSAPIENIGAGRAVDDRETIFKEYMRQLTTKDNAIVDKLQAQIDAKFESLSALGTAEAEAKARVSQAQANSRTSAIALDRHKLKSAGERNALEILMKALTVKKENIDKKLQRAEERAAVKMRSAQIKDKNTAMLRALQGEASDGRAKTASGHRSTTIAKPQAASNHHHHRMSVQVTNSSFGRNSVVPAKHSSIIPRKKSKVFFEEDQRSASNESLSRRASLSQSQGSSARRNSNAKSLIDASGDSVKRRNSSVSQTEEAKSHQRARRRSSATAVSVTTVASTGDSTATSESSSHIRRGSKVQRRASIDIAVSPRPPVESSRGHMAKPPPRPSIVRGTTTLGIAVPGANQVDETSMSASVKKKKRKPSLTVDTKGGKEGNLEEDSNSSLGSCVFENSGEFLSPTPFEGQVQADDSAMEVIRESTDGLDKEDGEERLADAYQLCGVSQSAVLVGTYMYFMVDQRLLKIEKETPVKEDVITETVVDTYVRKFDQFKPALPKDVYYKAKRKSAPMLKKRMFSTDDLEDQASVENPMVKYLVIDGKYELSFDFSEALITVNRVVAQLQNLGYLDAPASTGNALCNLFSYFNVAFLLDDFYVPAPVIARHVYSFAAEGSAKIWRRYNESLQAIRYQDALQKEDELRRFCSSLVKYSIDTFLQVITAEQNYFKSDYSLTVRETDVNVWVRMSEVLQPVLAICAVIVNTTYHSILESRDKSEDETELDSRATPATLLASMPVPPTESGLGSNMNIYLNHASEHVFSSVCLANGRSGNVEAAQLMSTKPPSSYSSSVPKAATEPKENDRELVSRLSIDSEKVKGQTYYALSFLHATGFFFVLYRAAFMTSMIGKATRNPYFKLLKDWLLVHFPNCWKDEDVSVNAPKGSSKQLLLRDMQLLRAFSSYFYYTSLGVEVMDIEECEKCFMRELAVLAAYTDIFGKDPALGGPEGGDGNAPVLGSKGGINSHDMALVDLIAKIVPSALPVMVVLRILCKLAAKQVKVLAITTLDATEAAQECSRMAALNKTTGTTATSALPTGGSQAGPSQLESIVMEKLIPAAQKATYKQLEGLTKELLSLIEDSICEYEARLSTRNRRLDRLDSVIEEEEALGIKQQQSAILTDESNAAIAVELLHVNVTAISTSDDPFVSRGNQRVLDLPYELLKRLEGILIEFKDLARAIGKGTKILSHMVTLRMHSLFEAMGTIMLAVKTHRKNADVWLQLQEDKANMQELIAANRRSIIGVCEAMLDACGACMDSSTLRASLNYANLSCDRIKSARRKLKYASCFEKKLDTAVSSSGHDDKDSNADKLDVVKSSVSALRANIHPGIRRKLLESSNDSKAVTPELSSAAPGSTENSVGISEKSRSELDIFKEYLMNQMSIALVQTSHYKSEWEELVEDATKRSGSVHSTNSTLSEQMGQALQNQEIALDSTDIPPSDIVSDIGAEKDVRLSDLLGVPSTTPGRPTSDLWAASKSEGETGTTDHMRSDLVSDSLPRRPSRTSHRDFDDANSREQDVVPGMHLSLTRGVLKTGSDVLAHATA